jgi:flagellar assembly protein FliH
MMTNSSDEYPLAFPPGPKKKAGPARPAFPPPPPAPVTPATRAFPQPPDTVVHFDEHVLRDERAAAVRTARFDVDLRKRAAPPPELVAQVRAEAEAAGYAAGWAQGRREAQQAAQAQADRDAQAVEDVMAAQAVQVDRAIAAIAAAAGELERRAIPTVNDIENTITETALMVAEAVIGREVRTAGYPGRDALNPADRMTIGLSDGTTELVMDGRPITLVDDPRLQPGDAVAICDATTIDARLGPALERVREVLGL